MKPSTVALLVLGVAGAGAGIYFLTRSSGGVAEAAAPPPDPRLAAIAGATKLGIAAVGVAGKTIAAVGTGAAKAAATVVSSVVAMPAKTVTAVANAAINVTTAPIKTVTGLFTGPSLSNQTKDLVAKDVAARQAAYEELTAKGTGGIASAFASTGWGAKKPIAAGG